MADLNFPSSPTVGQIYTGPTGSKWTWDGISWNTVNPSSGYSGFSGYSGYSGVYFSSANTTTNTTITPSTSVTQYEVTALSTSATISAPSGTPNDAQKLVIRIKDNGTSQVLTWNGIYRALGIVLPANTLGGTAPLYIGCIYNSQDACWDAVAVS